MDDLMQLTPCFWPDKAEVVEVETQVTTFIYSFMRINDLHVRLWQLYNRMSKGFFWQ